MLLIRLLYVTRMNSRWLLIKRLVQIKIVEINWDFIDCLNASFPPKSTVKSTSLLHIEQHMPNIGVGGALKQETERYVGQPLEQPLGPFCPNHIEDKQHVILHCPAYDSLRQNLFRIAWTRCEGFCRINDIEKIIVVFSTKSLVRIVAKSCILILWKRNTVLYM